MSFAPTTFVDNIHVDSVRKEIKIELVLMKYATYYQLHDNECQIVEYYEYLLISFYFYEQVYFIINNVVWITWIKE